MDHQNHGNGQYGAGHEELYNQQNYLNSGGAVSNGLQFPLVDNHTNNVTSHSPTHSGRPNVNRTEEDERFFKLAKEAIVATANAKALGTRSSATTQGQENMGMAETSPMPQHESDNQITTKIMDPTLNDLFTRLQYVSSPHGNPIKNGQNIRVNENGQLMIKEFYQGFPNLNNDIFTNLQNSMRTDRLVGDNPFAHSDLAYPSTNQSPIHQNQVNQDPISQKLHTSTNPNGNSSFEDLPGDMGTKKSIADVPEDKKYICEKCNIPYKRSSDLKRHERQHYAIPPNICDQCGKGFARKDALKRHVGTATCRRNLKKKLYTDNLEFIRHSG